MNAITRKSLPAVAEVINQFPEASIRDLASDEIVAVAGGATDGASDPGEYIAG